MTQTTTQFVNLTSLSTRMRSKMRKNRAQAMMISIKKKLQNESSSTKSIAKHTAIYHTKKSRKVPTLQSMKKS